MGLPKVRESGNSFEVLVGEFYADMRRPLMKDVRKISVTINGCEYHNLEEVPPELRAIYSKAVETAGELEAKGEGVSELISDVLLEKETFEYNGRTYNNREELPREAREALEKFSATHTGEKIPHRTCGVTKVLFEDARATEEPERKKSSTGWVIFALVLLVLVLLFCGWEGSSLRIYGDIDVLRNVFERSESPLLKLVHIWGICPTEGVNKQRLSV